ncbi:MAG: hypothetical protein TQ37_05740 [Candidatus Synechococcus spongiarum 15L]|uniref:Uncharacterized protein n=3 Tax=Candidatus Synechococcus spongiarum TaxID=431041 RepID=A0A1T1CI81_9SYNE|nr:hypothetical protein [Candidatus Synechococcus spongiarum]KKZ12306.1 MAG: hypothetical protein TQ37_05740 [Candidatus Synechococcus spongiarum 15L]OOV28376.1 hypothetical protein BV61_06095 [Candidatus Synechococcus spongiarum LMB bulk15M]OOV35410.1 hypothetical protein BV53_03875 [Candidatus Synechococcus spongiarum LMB bulk15N]
MYARSTVDAHVHVDSGNVRAGKNLDVMRGMNSACMHLIVLDPSFNSNRHYEAPIGSTSAAAAFKDAWTLDDVDVCEHGEPAELNRIVRAGSNRGTRRRIPSVVVRPPWWRQTDSSDKQALISFAVGHQAGE